ncbi:2-dehydropantoate 2-reductase [[Actinomadura] parvosata subsp. kistnae]|uniref:2-dehydropantoate 2-reductase n=1 Tax=[Actinomadura] parvosata subsp. kistnae TaxID=1909395 RepID=A0A1V0ABA1_9ACTN|nr:2-dehydropantoate 2-reductase N-terminal domain-containing protein [Nonomuraea sp. ATCC 55076]AQZ67488.1 2-dehydropantoate 2-reductase [Nonomuraea sp. ATCC 55076]SPL94253.1 2-dehydropantoate 2-reductase [Actinomadura parvosata subsp. kistnae]
MRYIVIGAGAVGGTIGARLFQGGHEVLLIARGAHYEALRRDGLRLITPEGSETLDLPAADGPVPTRDDDVLILATKSQDTIAALAPWPADLPVVCAQNGVANERMVLRRFERVYGMCVWLPAQIPQPGVIAAHGHPYSGMLHVGRYPQAVDDDGLAAKIAGDLSKHGLVGRAVPDVMRWKYAKLLSNLGNAAEALLGHVPALTEVVERARAEARAVLAHAGIAYATPEEEAEVRGHKVDARPIEGVSRGGGSSWQSLARGSGSIEADYLNGEIVLLGREHGLATPVNETLRREANRFAREKQPPGSMPPETLTALIDARSAAGSR